MANILNTNKMNGKNTPKWLTLCRGNGCEKKEQCKRYEIHRNVPALRERKPYLDPLYCRKSGYINFKSQFYVS